MLTGSQCADITFRSNATDLSGDACKTTAGLTITPVTQQVNGTAPAGNGTGTNNKNAGSVAGVNMVVLTSVVGLTMAVVFGIGL